MVRQLVGARRSSSRVAQRLIAEDDGARVRRPRRLRGKQRRQVGLVDSGCAVAFHAVRTWRARPAPGASISPIGRSGAATTPSSRRVRRATSCSMVERLEQVGRVLHHAGDPARRPVRSPLLAEAQRQVELGRRGRDRLDAHPSARAARAPRRRAFCSANITWNSGDDATARSGLQLLDQPLERHVLVRVGRQRRPRGPGPAARGRPGRPTGRCAAPGC